MAKTKPQVATPDETTLAETINELGEGHGPNARAVIENYTTRLSSTTEVTQQVQRLVPVVAGFTPKIAEMAFYNRDSAYKGDIKSVLEDMYDKDLLYGAGREYGLPNFIPVTDFNTDAFNPTQTTTPVMTVSTIFYDAPKQIELTLKAELMRAVVNNAAQLTALVSSIRSSKLASLQTYMENVLIDDYILKTAQSTSPLSFHENGTANLSAADRVAKYADTTSNNMKECLRTISWLIEKMTTVATNYFNIGGANSNSFFVSDRDDIKILCSNKFKQLVRYGLELGLFKPELLAPILDKLVALPDVKLNLPTATNQPATIAAWTNRLPDNQVIILNTKHSFKFGKQFRNSSNQFYPKNEALQLTTTVIPYYSALKMGQMLVYESANLNVLPGNVMENVN